MKKFFYRIVTNITRSIQDQSSIDIGLELNRQARSETLEYLRSLNYMPILIDGRSNLIKLAIDRKLNDGLIVEFGVANGLSINMISSYAPDSVVYGFDTFQGLPDDWSLAQRKSFTLNGIMPKVNKNVELIKGLFQDSLPIFLASHQFKWVSFIHIDCDIYQSTKDIFDNLGPFITKGTLILFDEFWNYPDWMNHEFLAFSEWVEKTSSKFRIVAFNKSYREVLIEITS